MKYTRLTKDERRIMCEINKDGKNNPWKLGIPRETVRKSAQRLQALGLVTFYETLDPENDYTISLTGEGEAFMAEHPKGKAPFNWRRFFAEFLKTSIPSVICWLLGKYG